MMCERVTPSELLKAYDRGPGSPDISDRILARYPYNTTAYKQTHAIDKPSVMVTVDKHYTSTYFNVS